MRARVISLVVVVFIVSGLRASAQGPQDLKRLSIEQLMQIDVTLATRTPEPLATAPTAISIVTGDDIGRAGVHVAPFNNGTWSVTARGSQAVRSTELARTVAGVYRNISPRCE